MLAKECKRRHNHLRKWAKQEGIQAFRLYDHEIPDIPLQIDIYGKYLHINAILNFRDKTDEEQKGWLITMAEAVARALGVAPEHLFIKNRKKSGGNYEAVQGRLSELADGAGHAGVKQSCILDVEEGGLLFEINLSDYLDQGLFLDHRNTRAFVRDIAEGARLLNLFSYTASFTVYAAQGGALTTSVDMSNTYCNWAQRNMEKNNFIVGKLHTIIRANVLWWMDKAIKGANRFDIIVCDPPTFSNSNKMKTAFNVQGDHLWLIQNCLRLLAKNGLLIFSSNFRQFKLRERELKPLAYIEEITHKTIPRDFAKRKPHRCWIIRKK